MKFASLKTHLTYVQKIVAPIVPKKYVMSKFSNRSINTVNNKRLRLRQISLKLVDSCGLPKLTLFEIPKKTYKIQFS